MICNILKEADPSLQKRKPKRADSLIEAACCISTNGKDYNIDEDFTGWVRLYIIDKLKKKGSI